MSKPSEVVILAEDRTQQRLAYWYLRKLGINRNLIRSERLPAGKGSGEQRVRESYASNVKAHRTKSAKVNKGLVVMIDADTRSVTQRLNQLSSSLKKAGLPPRRPDERIALLIPKRNVETWVLCLNDQRVQGQPINEWDDYKPLSKALRIEDQVRPATEVFFKWSRPNAQIPTRCVASLSQAIPEVQLLE